LDRKCRRKQRIENKNRFLEELIEGKEYSIEEILNLQNLLGYGEAEFVLAKTQSEKHKHLRHIINFVERNIEGSFCFEYKEELLMFCPVRKSMEALIAVLENVAKYNDIRIGVSYPFKDIRALKSGYVQTGIALMSSLEKVVCTDTRSIMDYISSEICKSTEGVNICHPALFKLKAMIRFIKQSILILYIYC
jgi:hypothetical protein